MKLSYEDYDAISVLAISDFIVNQWTIYAPVLVVAAIALLVWRAMRSSSRHTSPPTSTR